MQNDGNQFAEELAELALSLHDLSSFSDTVDRVLEFAVKAMSCAYAGVLVVRDGTPHTVATTHPLVADLDASQAECGEGPDLDDVVDRQAVLVPDIRRETRWPARAERVAATGVRSMIGTRLRTSTEVIGSLNLYDVEVGRFSSEDVDVAHLLARHAAVALDHAREAENLWRAIDARNLIGQAQGILMERFAIDADQAFAVLRRYSQDHNVRLQVVAQRLVESGRLPSAPAPPTRVGEDSAPFSARPSRDALMKGRPAQGGDVHERMRRMPCDAVAAPRPGGTTPPSRTTRQPSSSSTASW